jgi:acylphosphatase
VQTPGTVIVVRCLSPFFRPVHACSEKVNVEESSASPRGDQQQREVYYSGRVQGVGFRYTVRSLATGFDVTGFVRNLSDGQVYLVVEGTSREIDALLDAIKKEMAYYIVEVRESVMPATGRFSSFEIRH